MPIVETHSEALGQQEIYLVLRGRTLFTIDGNEHELGAGQFVFVREPSLRRGAVALDADAVVLALGGTPGRPHEVSAWEPMFAAVPAANREDWDGMEARGGRHLDALLHLQRAVALESKWADNARRDSDFAAIRGEPGFP